MTTEFFKDTKQDLLHMLVAYPMAAAMLAMSLSETKGNVNLELFLLVAFAIAMFLSLLSCAILTRSSGKLVLPVWSVFSASTIFVGIVLNLMFLAFALDMQTATKELKDHP